MRHAFRTASLALGALALLFGEGRALAHALGLSSGEYRAEGRSVAVRMSFAAADVLRMAPGLDGDGDGRLSALEVSRGKGPLGFLAGEGVIVRGDGARCTGVLVDAALTEGDGVLIQTRHLCPASPGHIALEVPFLERLPPGHKHVARTVGKATIDAVLSSEARGITFDGSVAVAGSEPPSKISVQGPSGFFSMGLRHVLSGWDHVLFLLGLALLPSSRRSLIVAVTAFTVGHTAALALAALGLVAPSPRLVEPLIALSIAYVGLEAARPGASGQARSRWPVTLPFGFVHGFGFAGALIQARVPGDGLLSALVLFNLGVEVAQLAALLPFALGLAWLRRRALLGSAGTTRLGGLLMIAGLGLAIARLLSP